jgi:hypothetical protein
MPRRLKSASDIIFNHPFLPNERASLSDSNHMLRLCGVIVTTRQEFQKSSVRTAKFIAHTA